MAAEHAKEACFFLLDVTETMGPHLADAKTVLKGLLESHVASTGSSKASALLADWATAKSRFKLLVPPSERAAMGLTQKQAVAA